MLLERAMYHVGNTRDSIPEIAEGILELWLGMGLAGALPSPDECDCNSPDISLECHTICEGEGGDSGSGSGAYTYINGPLMKTEWNQGGIFNDLCPNMGCTSTGDGRAWTGCVATAMAQVMRFHQYPATLFNWDAMPNRDEGIPDAGLASLMRFCGEYVDMDYGCSASSASTGKVKDALILWGYSGDIAYQNFDRSRVMTDIDRRRPVILRGCSERSRWLGSLWYVYDGCHAWVCDSVKKIVSSNGSSTTELHMNWGWGTDRNNWTYDFETSDGTRYQHVRKMMINIHP